MTRVHKDKVRPFLFVFETDGIVWNLKLASNGYLLASSKGEKKSYFDYDARLGIIADSEYVRVSNFPILNRDMFEAFSLIDILNNPVKRMSFAEILLRGQCRIAD